MTRDQVIIIGMELIDKTQSLCVLILYRNITMRPVREIGVKEK